MIFNYHREINIFKAIVAVLSWVILNQKHTMMNKYEHYVGRRGDWEHTNGLRWDFSTILVIWSWAFCIVCGWFTSRMKRWSDTMASPAKHMMERLSNVWLTAVQFFRPFGFPATETNKVKLIAADNRYSNFKLVATRTSLGRSYHSPAILLIIESELLCRMNFLMTELVIFCKQDILACCHPR